MNPTVTSRIPNTFYDQYTSPDAEEFLPTLRLALMHHKFSRSTPYLRLSPTMYPTGAELYSAAEVIK